MNHDLGVKFIHSGIAEDLTKVLKMVVDRSKRATRNVMQEPEKLYTVDVMWIKSAINEKLEQETKNENP